MSLLRNITDGLRLLFRRERVDREFVEGLHGFLEMAVEEKMKQGMSHQEALRAVRPERGDLKATREVVRSAGWESFVETYWQDLRFGLRMLRKPPGFTVVAVVTLALEGSVRIPLFLAFLTLFCFENCQLRILMSSSSSGQAGPREHQRYRH